MDRALIPLRRAVVALAHVYSTTLLRRSVVAAFTAAPRYRETAETFAGVPVRARTLVLRLLQHAIPVADAARGEGVRFWVGELGRLLTFVASILRATS